MRAFLLFISIFTFTTVFAYADEVPLEVQRVQQKYQAPPNMQQLPVQIEQSYPNEESRFQSPYTFYPGSLRENIMHMAKQSGWPIVVWRPSYDYQWVGETHFPPEDIKVILRQILHDYPLQAVFYEGNHVLVISSRNVS